MDCGKVRNTKTASPRCVQCAIIHKQRHLIDAWLAGEHPGGSGQAISDTVRKYLLDKANYACSLCGFNTPHPVDGKTILEVDHMNGDGSDHRPENLRVLCPNCHALTPTYRGRNIGKGRPVYYLRVAQAHLD